jgi:hypothetical protein
VSQDTDMAAKARKIITSNWIDVSQVRIRVTRCVINLQGHVQTVGGDPDSREGTEGGMRKMDEELRALRGFRGIAYFFDNWQREPTGGWRCLSKKKEKTGKRGL